MTGEVPFSSILFSHTLFISIPLLVFPTLLLLTALTLSQEAFRSDLPQDVQKRLPEPSEQEQRRGRIFALLFLFSLLATIGLSTWLFLQHSGGSFTQAYAVALTMEILFALIDLLIVDWLFICTLRPRWLIPAGTRDCEGWRDYGFHLRELLQLKSISANMTIPLLVAGLIYCVDWLL